MPILRKFSLVFISLLLMYACNYLPGLSPGDPVVAEVNGDKIYLSELKKEFYKNKIPGSETESTTEQQELRDFLDLYVNYRLRLQSAQDAGYFTNSDILAELNEYEKQTAYPYWLENKIKNILLEEYIERSKHVVKASHILIAVGPNSTPADTLQIWNKLLEARSKALNGEHFDSLASIYSSAQRGQSMGGYLGIFPVGWAVKEFEDVAFNTPKDSISSPFRTQFGYHIVHVRDIIPAPAPRYVSHIFLMGRPQDGSLDDALERASDYYNKIQAGEDFENIAAEWSEDGQSAPMGGRIGWVSWGQYNEQFTQKVMEMEEINSISEPFYSGYGVHILKLDSIKTYKDEDTFRNEMLKNLQALPRYRNNKNITINNVRKSGNEIVFAKNFDVFEQHLNKYRGSSLNSVNIDDIDKQLIVYRINETDHTIEDYYNWLLGVIDTTSVMNYSMNYREQFFAYTADNNIVGITKKMFPDYARLSKEYLNGLVIFKVSEDSVWNYSRQDTLVLRSVYDKNPDQYQLDTRYHYHRISATNDSVLVRAGTMLKNGLSPDSLRNEITGILVRSDVVSDLSEFPFNLLENLEKQGITEVFNYRNRRTIFYLTEIDESRRMSFDEAYFRLVSEYQPIREKLWLERLSNKYKAKRYPERI